MISAVLSDIQAAGAVTGSKTNIAGNLHRQISTDLTLQTLVHGHVILFYKKGYLKKCSCIYCSVCCQLDIMLEGKVVWDELNRYLILHSETFLQNLPCLSCKSIKDFGANQFRHLVSVLHFYILKICFSYTFIKYVVDMANIRGNRILSYQNYFHFCAYCIIYLFPENKKNKIKPK